MKECEEAKKKKKRRGQKKNEPLIARPWKNYNGGCLIGMTPLSATAEYISIAFSRFQICYIQNRDNRIHMQLQFYLLNAVITREYYYYCRSLS